jgi:hypothetical protein
MPKAARLPVVLLATVVAVTALGFRAARAFDHDGHVRQAAAVLAAPDKVTYQLPPVPPQVAPSPGVGGELSYRPGAWLSVITLHGLDPVAGDERYLVFLRNWSGWTLVGAARPGADGTAQVRSAAEPRPRAVYEVVVTRAVDDATSVPHGQPLLHWFDASIAPRRARPFDFARGA